MAELSIYCGCGDKLTRLAVLERLEPISFEGYADWPVDDLPAVWDPQGALGPVEDKGLSSAIRAAIHKGEPFDIDELMAQRAHTPPAVREPTDEEIEGGHGRWEWVCRRCGRHHQARDKRLRAALDAGRRRLVFGVDL